MNQNNSEQNLVFLMIPEILQYVFYFQIFVTISKVEVLKLIDEKYNLDWYKLCNTRQ